MSLLNKLRFSRQTITPKQRYGGEIVHSERDEHGLIQVIDSPICRSLHFDTAVKQSRYFFQAPFSLAFEYQQVMEQKLDAFHYQHNIKRLLMLGVGGATLASKLFISHPKLDMTLVDLRRSVIDIAHDYFHLPIDQRIKTITADAAEFVQHQGMGYDAVIVDIFDAQGIPQPFTEAAFLDALCQQLRAPGLVLFNLWQSSPEPTLKVIKHFESIGKIELFPIHSSKNIVLSYRKAAP